MEHQATTGPEETKDSSYPTWIEKDGARSQMLMSLGMIRSLGNDDLSVEAFSTTNDDQAPRTVSEMIEEGIHHIGQARIYRLQRLLQKGFMSNFLHWCFTGIWAQVGPTHRSSEEFEEHPEWITSCCLREWHRWDQAYNFDTLKGGPSFYNYTVSERERLQRWASFTKRGLRLRPTRSQSIVWPFTSFYMGWL